MIKKGIKVKILTGKDKNKDGDVIEIDRKNNRAKVKGINMVKTCENYKRKERWNSFKRKLYTSLKLSNL